MQRLKQFYSSLQFVADGPSFDDHIVRSHISNLMIHLFG
jgi:hypothetical protein